MNAAGRPAVPVERRDRVSAIILAGGVGSRAGDHGIAKQYVRVAGKPVLQHTLEIFQLAPNVDEIVLVADNANSDLIETMLLDGGITKLICIVAPGLTRAESTCNALAALGQQDRKILIHDGVRPLLEQRIIDDCVAALDTFDAVDVVIPSADTLVEVDADGIIVSIPERRRYRRGQTPQGFRLSVLRRAYELAAARPDFTATDDCRAVLEMLPDVAIATVDGSETNMKITYPQDYLAADQLFRLRALTWQAQRSPGGTPLTGHNYVVFGGSRGIGKAVDETLRAQGAHVMSFSLSDGYDIREPEDIDRALTTAQAETGRIDGVVVTAGVLLTGELTSLSHANMIEMVDINLVGSALVAQRAHRYLRASRGSLVLFGSSSYTRGRQGYALYSATKAAIVNLTQALADEWTGDGIRVNCLSPARTDTDLRRTSFGSDDDLLSSAEVALATAALLRGETTGSVVNVDRRSVARGPATREAGAEPALYPQAS